jgi:1-acyl-sn-glycerol-3-phosphate acyltransferase
MREPSRLLRPLLFALLIKPIIALVFGLNVRRGENIPTAGPAILAANHNSHLDTMVLLSMMPLSLLHKVRPVAAMDYFMRNPLLAWFSERIIGIIPIKRGAARDEDPLADPEAALAAGNILVIFPEGTRGEPEEIARFKKGIARLAERGPDVPVIPVFMHGLGKSLPKGAFIPVPLFLDVFVGEARRWNGDRNRFMQELADDIQRLADEGAFPQWE